MRRSGAWVALATVLAACADRPAGPNVLLVTLDTTRADALGAYGHAAGATPHLDALAARGTVFERAVTPIGTTFPAHASLLTGLVPKRHRVESNFDRLADEVETLAERLARAGYDTAAWVSFESMLSRGGLHQGFATASATATGKPRGWPTSGTEVTREAVAWLLHPRRRPFFAWVHYFEPHSPYDLTPYATARLEGYAGPLAGGLSVEAFYALYYRAPLPAADQAALRALYDGEVNAADAFVGELLATLERDGALADTIVIVTADHGQQLGEHGLFGHAFSVWEETLHVPLVMAGPGIPAGRRVPDRVGLIDVAPTVLELLGLAAPADLDGRSVAALLGGGPLAPRRYVAEVQNHLRPGEIYDDQALAVYDGNRKYVWQRGRLQAFDLAADPGETRPLADLTPAAARELEALATRYYEGSPRGAPLRGEHAVEDELRALGYLE